MNISKTFPQDLPAQFPIRAGKSNAVVTIYKTVSQGYDEFKIPYMVEGVRKFHRFSKYDEARNRGNSMLEEMFCGNIEAITLTNEARASYQNCLEVLKPIGISLELAVLRFAESYDILGGDHIIPASREFKKRHLNGLPNKSVADSVDEFILAKTNAKRSDRHVEDLTYRLGKFKSDCNHNLADVDEVMLRTFLDGLNLSPRSQNNFRGTLVSFFRWCVKKKYLTADWSEFAAIEIVEDNEGAIEIFTPNEITALLAHAPDPLVPFLAIGAFAGLRSSEICRLDWQQIGIGQGKYIEVKARDARKTKQRRLIPIKDNLRAWLKLDEQHEGKIWPHTVAYLYEALPKVCRDAKVKWKQNALRHSYISYRMAEIQDAAKVSLEAGNSPQMIFSNYRELVTPEESQEYFSVLPTKNKGEYPLTPRKN